MDTRQQQIAVLLKNVLNIQEKYNNIYEVLWYDPNINRTVCLSITLPPQFPVIPPIFRVSPQITHPWVDANGLIVGHKKLGANWNQHISLANVTNEIITELKANKPSIPPQQSYTGYNSLGKMPNTNPYYYNRPVPPPRPTPSIAMPSYQGYQGLGMNMPVPQPYLNNTNPPNNNINNNDVDLNDLDTLSLEELKEILNNDSKRKEYINGKDKIKEMYNVKEEMSLSNKNLAEKILATKDDFEKLKSDLRQQQTILKEEKEKFESLMNEQNKYMNNYTPTQLHSLYNKLLQKLMKIPKKLQMIS